MNDGRPNSSIFWHRIVALKRAFQGVVEELVWMLASGASAQYLENILAAGAARDGSAKLSAVAYEQNTVY